MELDRKKLENRIWTDTLEISFISTAYFLRDKLGWSAQRTVACLMNINEIAESVRSDNVKLDELRENLHDEHKMLIRQNCRGVVIETLK